MEQIEKYKSAGKIAAEVREWSRKLIKPGARALDVAEAIENRITEKGAGIAFPVNVSLNDIAAHYTPQANDTLEFAEDDLVTIDLGVHIDGYIADTAYTIDLSGENGGLIEASDAGLQAAIDTIRHGAQISKIGETVESAIRRFGFRPIENLTGHQLRQYELHGGIAIPNIKVSREYRLEEGQVFAIEPFSTDGRGFVVESQNAMIFSFLRKVPVRMMEGRAVLQEAEKRRGMPFAERWFAKKTNPLKLKMVLRELVEREALQAYPTLHEVDRGLVSQSEHTVIVQRDSCEVTTL